jgi:5-methyltetrahydrofolate--homocysteine methyltransferase
MNSFLQSMLSDSVVLTDGAWGTQLQQRGLAIGACPDAWNLTHPDLVAQVAAGYVAAGSKVILSNTFGATCITLERHGLADRAADINRAGASISRAAAGDSCKLFASMGPSAKMLAMGEVTEDQLLAAFTEQAQALAAGGADALVIETMSDPAEAVIAVAAAASTGLPVVACMTYGSGRHADRTIMGTTPEQASEALLNAGASIVGANCGQGAEQMVDICRRLRAASGMPVWIKPNAGLPQIVDGSAIYTTTPEEFASNVMALVEAGAGFVGGCCGTSPLFIAALSDALKARAGA